MRTVRLALALALLTCGALTAVGAQSTAAPIDSEPSILRTESRELFALANQARLAARVSPLRSDPALYAAALQHCLRMAAAGQISHRYEGEADLATRAAQAGAHFSLLEENVATGWSAAVIHSSWMESPGHRANLLNPDVDRVGIAAVVSHGQIYAVADYSRAVPALSQLQVEAAVSERLRAEGLVVSDDPADARAYCAQEGKARLSVIPAFRMLWESPDANRLPQALIDRIASGRYQRATVGSCPPQGAEGGFTFYRMAVLLYGTRAAPPAKPLNSQAFR
jgi:uncharacterized protein YkwD